MTRLAMLLVPAGECLTALESLRSKRFPEALTGRVSVHCIVYYA